MANLTVQQMEELLSEDERKYCEVSVANTFLPANQRKSNKEIAEELGYSDRTLRNWEKKPVVMDYMRYLTNTERDSFYPVVMRQLHSAITGGRNGEPSIRAIELWLKASGMLIDQQHVFQETEYREPMTRKDVTDQINDLQRYIK